ncbi:hypothetical protein ACFSHT_33180 [Paraburkholderia silviterrae]|uniref:Uncharacterized protein n=1 Tax=Paraburkholderia silviterrae TaxID=2528715 RepID=A0A4R5M2Y8_9BURK|nr:hypothetical protein [Paraburkholderia silviterrae]TDG19878.1 hypothetical protein EYW47_28885 [Paraburkholderia silviterrae]
MKTKKFTDVIRISPAVVFSREVLFPPVKEEEFQPGQSVARVARAPRAPTATRAEATAPAPSEQSELF